MGGDGGRLDLACALLHPPLMNRLGTVARIWIGFAIAVSVALVLGALGALSAARQAPGWAAGAIALAAILVGAAGAAVTASVGRSLKAAAGEAERVAEAVAGGKLDVRFELDRLAPDLRVPFELAGGALERLSRSVRGTSEKLSALSRGEIPPAASDREAGELGRAREALNAVLSQSGRMLDDLQSLSAAARQGRTEDAIPEGRHAGRFQEVLRAQQGSVAQLVRRAQSLEQILDAVPLPLSASDGEGRTTFLNASAEQLLDLRRASVLGKPGEKDRLTAAARRRGRALAIEAAEIKAASGEAAGRLEIGHDQTVLARIAEYSVSEMSKLARALEQLGAGSLAIDIAIAQGDAHTEDRRKQLTLFAQAIGRVRDSISALVRDATRVAEAAVAGRLSERIDGKAHPGEFRKVAEGINHTLDAVLAPVAEASRVLDELARRNLRARVTSSYGGDHARIKESVNAAAEALHHALAQVSGAVEQVSSAASQIAASSQAVASGASQQAASLEQTSSSIETVASMTRQSADNAQQANHLAEAARGAAGQGTAAVEQMQTAMSRIKASAEGTSQIIRDINDIAFQTNLLALNAAVEAARAGEAGRGFAVVAEEVRSLALRAKEAAMKTEELIRQSVKEAGEGEVTAKQVAGKLAEIAGAISKVTDIISEIAAGAREQSTGIDQVNRAVGEMDRVIQQNAASAEQSSSAASELSGQAEELASMVGAFQLERPGARSATPARLPAPAAAPAPRNAAAALDARAAPSPARPPAPPTLPTAPAASLREADRVFPMDDPSDLKDF